ncbi:hypothetical protein V6N12_021058 [Hibiscus sabdariffa]|uniref:Uncharacterized protein n=1 Tax=Hibiscus sabdariffa TaxID=183260 RepID=A0ABR2B3G3_9ROSI
MAASCFSQGLGRGLALWWTEETKITIIQSRRHFIDTKISTSGEDEWPDDKARGALFDLSQAKWLLDFLDRECLMEIPLNEGAFTWSNQRCDDNSILEKVDRTIVSPEWSNVFPKASGIVDVALALDHASIILFLQGLCKKVKKGFKFEFKWLLENECIQKVKEGWNTPSPHCNFKIFGKN